MIVTLKAGNKTVSPSGGVTFSCTKFNGNMSTDLELLDGEKITVSIEQTRL
jgi:hypothetical protein